MIQKLFVISLALSLFGCASGRVRGPSVSLCVVTKEKGIECTFKDDKQVFLSGDQLNTTSILLLLDQGVWLPAQDYADLVKWGHR